MEDSPTPHHRSSTLLRSSALPNLTGQNWLFILDATEACPGSLAHPRRKTVSEEQWSQDSRLPHGRPRRLCGRLRGTVMAHDMTPDPPSVLQLVIDYPCAQIVHVAVQLGE